MAEDPAVTSALSSGLSHVAPLLAGHTLTALGSLARPDLLSKLKELGVDRLGDRQKAATAIAKAARAPPTFGAASDAGPVVSRDDLKPQVCHHPFQQPILFTDALRDVVAICRAELPDLLSQHDSCRRHAAG